MRNFLLISLVLIIYMKFDEITDLMGYNPDDIVAHDEKVVLYATSWCGYCDKIRALLKKNNIPYHEYDINRSDVGNRQFERLGGGGVPVMLIDGTVVRGYSPGKILELAKRTVAN